MNKTKIEWCDSTWNPVTGCLHNCNYCYAKKIAKRFGEHKEGQGIIELHWKRENPYPYDFYPTFHKYRLDEPARKTRPRKIFVCSMADLFGDWVPDEWIEEVYTACQKADWHQYLFLTKNPRRYSTTIYRSKLDYRWNMWLGTTVNNSADFIPPCKAEELAKLKGCNKFLSIEPLLSEFTGIALENLKHFDWVIIGAETGNRKGKVIPEKRWVDNIVTACKETDIPVFMKNSLKEIMGDDFIQEWPERMGLK